MRECAVCHVGFYSVVESNLYCSATCKRSAYKRRRKDKDFQSRFELRTAGRCPTPFKIGYSSYQQASFSEWADKNWIYRCGCGALHFTSKNKGNQTLKVAEVLEHIVEKQAERSDMS